MKLKSIFLSTIFWLIIFFPYQNVSAQGVKLVKDLTTMVPKFFGDIPVLTDYLPKEQKLEADFRYDHLAKKKFIHRTTVSLAIAKNILLKTKEAYVNAEDETGLFKKTRQEYENALKSRSWKKEFDIEAYRTGMRLYQARYAKGKDKTIDFQLQQADRFDAKAPGFIRDVALRIVGRDYKKARPKEAASRLGFASKNVFRQPSPRPSGYEGLLVQTLTVDADFPDDIFLPIGFVLQSIQKQGGDWHLSFFDGGKGGLEDFATKYKKKFESQEWTITKFDPTNNYEGSAGWKFIGGDRAPKTPDSYRFVAQKGSRKVDLTIVEPPHFGMSVEMNITQ